MNVLFWNCQGLRGYPTVRHLKDLKKVYDPDLIFLIETKNKDDVVRDVAAILGYNNVRCIPPQGYSGGIALLWKKSIDVCIYISTPRLFDCKINKGKEYYYCSFVYGHPIQNQRHHLWEQLERVKINRQGAWMLCGDFNEILNQDEKQGGRVRDLSSMTLFP